MQVAVISGARGYLGSAIMREFEAHDWNVVSLSPRSKLSCDCTDAKQVAAAFSRIKSKYKVVDACIHAAAAPIDRKAIFQLTAKEFKHQIDVSTFGAFNLFKYVAPLLRPGGVLIGITSSTLLPGRVQPSGSYVPAKYALQGLLRVLSQELPEQRVYAVAPDFLPGGLNRDIPESVRTFIGKKTGLSVEDVAHE